MDKLHRNYLFKAGAMDATVRMVLRRKQTNKGKRVGADPRRGGRARRRGGGGDAAYLQTGFKFMVARGPVLGSGPGVLSLVKERQKVGCWSRARSFYDAINCLAE